jgi:hypothetical protein
LLGFALAGLIFGLLLFVPHLFHPDWVNVRINQHSLAYIFDLRLPAHNPALISTYLHIRLFGLTLIAVIAVVYAFLAYAYISLFCFRAGLGTLHLIYVILKSKYCRERPELFS